MKLLFLNNNALPFIMQLTKGKNEETRILRYTRQQSMLKQQSHEIVTILLHSTSIEAQ